MATVLNIKGIVEATSVSELLVGLGMASCRGEARRFAGQHAVSLNGDRFDGDPDAPLDLSGLVRVRVGVGRIANVIILDSLSGHFAAELPEFNGSARR